MKDPTLRILDRPRPDTHSARQDRTEQRPARLERERERDRRPRDRALTRQLVEAANSGDLDALAA